MNNTFFHRVTRQTPTRFWINNVTKKEAQLAIDYGAIGCTQNPSYTHKMLTHQDSEAREYALNLMKQHIKQSSDNNRVEITLQKELINNVAEIFMPLYEKTGGVNGYVSIQGDPLDESEATITDLAKYHREGTFPNIMAKIPATGDGLKSIYTLIREGVPLNITEVFALAQVKEICDLYNQALAEGVNVPQVYVSHITGIYDEYMTKWVKENNVTISSPDVLYQAGMIIAKKTYEYMHTYAPGLGYIGGGARGLQHFTEMIGARANITINWIGTADKLLEQDPPIVNHFNRPVNSLVLDELLTKIPAFREGYFIDGLKTDEYEEFGPVELFRDTFVNSWNNALKIIGDAR